MYMPISISLRLGRKSVCWDMKGFAGTIILRSSSPSGGSPAMAISSSAAISSVPEEYNIPGRGIRFSVLWQIRSRIDGAVFFWIGVSGFLQGMKTDRQEHFPAMTILLELRISRAWGNPVSSGGKRRILRSG